MPNNGLLINSNSQRLTGTQNDRQAYLSVVDSKYTYSQLQLPKETAKYCISNISCGKQQEPKELKPDSTH